MRTPRPRFSAKFVSCSLAVLFTFVYVVSCKKSDSVNAPAPVISYLQKVISMPVDMPMEPVKPDSTGGSITEYTINPLLPKGLLLNKLNGEISGRPSDTLLATNYIVTAKGPGGTDTDTLTLLIGTVGFNYSNTGTFVFETGSTALSSTPLLPVILAGSFTQFFVTPTSDIVKQKTGLTFDGATGKLSGVPNVLTSTTEVPTPYTFTVTGISTANKAASTVVNIIINDKKPSFKYTFTGTHSVSTDVGNTLTVTNLGVPIKKYRLAPGSPALPAGLSLDSTTGQIKGIPTIAGNATVVIRGLNSGGYQDVNVPLIINSTAITPQVRYMMSLFSGSLVDTLCPAIYSGNTIYLTKNPDNTQNISIYLNPMLTAGQIAGTAGNYTVAPVFAPGTTGENIALNSSNPSTGIISGIPGQFSAGSTTTHTITIANASPGGSAGTFNMNIVANTPFFTYNADNGKGKFSQNNMYGFVQGQPVGVAIPAPGTYPGYSANGLAPVGGTDVISYAIYPATTNTQPFANTGLIFNTTTGVISGTPTTATVNLGIYSFWDYIVVGKKADGSFTLYKIKIKIYEPTAIWGN